MKIVDDSGILNRKHIILLKDVVFKRLRATGLESQVVALKVVHGSPASEFQDKEKTVIILHIEPKHFSKPNIKWIICHEIQHRIDELNPHFGFDIGKKERYRMQGDDHFATILAHLWDIYIDGRLDKLGLYEIDPNETIGIRGQFFARDKCRMRLAKINTLESGGVHKAQHIHDRVWRAREGEFTYDQLADLCKKYVHSLER